MRFHPLFLLPLAVSALPPAKKDLTSVAKSVFCVVNNDVITALKAQTTATSYCSSYLSISTKTFSTTATVTPTSVHVTTTVTVTGDPYITTSTATETTTTDLHVSETITETDTATVTLTTSTVTLSCLSTAYTATTTAENQKRSAVQKPTCLPSSWAASAISSACSCLSIPTPSTTKTITTTLVPGTVTDSATQTLTPTSTSTVTTTETSANTITDYTTTTTTTTSTVYATATTISASGLTFRKYTHSFNANSANSGFTPSYFKTASVDFTGSLQDVDFSTPNWPSGSTYLTLDGNYFDSSQAAVLMQGFFVAQATGTYTISTSASYIDNYGYLWTGDAAYTWTDDTTAYAATRTGAGYYGGSTTITMNAGDAIPMTWLWANGGGVGQSHFVITTPSGSSTTDSTGYFAPACSSSVFT
ncbi:hypothetical protein GTA08_BOTSDO13428 [Botryosphaeria dothidea]|uniref:PA14 domain-containing protein n=1 Tax=Botryosphaeria dothidea TaxID=55169 RepID=A0A8H4N878_9PEZI|nr:hypothetical protein GTA08_BOTSDO13428 [Botryosphaeria dothidea]